MTKTRNTPICSHCNEAITIPGSQVMFIQVGVTTNDRANHFVTFVETDSKLIHIDCFQKMMLGGIFDN